MKHRKPLVFIAILLAGLFLWRTDLRQVAALLGSLSLRTLVLLLFLQLLGRSLVAFQWKHLANLRAPSATWGQMMYLNLMGTFFEGITPTAKFGSEGVKVWWLNRRLGMDTSDATALLVLQKTISGFGFAVIAAATMLVSLLHSRYLNLNTLLQELELVTMGWIALLIPGLVVLCALAVRRFPRTNRMRRWLKSAWDRLRSDARLVAATPANRCFHLAVSLAIWFNYAVQAWVAARGMNVHTGFWAMAAAVYLAYTAAMLPLLPGGIGTFESAMVFVLVGYGVAVSQAVALTLVIRIATFWLSFGASGVVMGYCWLHRRFMSSGSALAPQTHP